MSENENERFLDNGDGILTDTKFNLMWLRQDSYQIDGKWRSWQGARKFVARINEQTGLSDWRLSTTGRTRPE